MPKKYKIKLETLACHCNHNGNESKKFTIQDLNLNDVSLTDILTYEKDLINSVMKNVLHLTVSPNLERI